MRILIPALIVTVMGFSMAHAAPEKTSPFSKKSYGDGGGYKHPDTHVGQFFEAKLPSPAELKPERPQLPAEVTPEIQPVAAIASRPRPRSAASVIAKTGVPGPSTTETEMPLPKSIDNKEAPSGATTARVEDGALDSASDDARRDYETRLFQAAPAPRLPGLADTKKIPLLDLARSASTGDGMLFVSLELAAQEAGTLRDAVAGLGAAAAFRPDARFQPIPGASGSVRISGWLPASRLGDAIARPGVKRVEVERSVRPAADRRVTGDYLLTLRVSDPAFAQTSIAASVREVTAATGFRLDRVFNIKTVPGEGATALVSGTMPVSQLARALGLPGVIKINSAPSSVTTSTVPVAPVKKEGFLKFVMARSFWLVLLTVLLALPTCGKLLKKGLAMFVPYR